MRHAIEGWLKLGRIKPAIDDLTGELIWTGADLFGALAVQIALAAETRDRQVFCLACGKAYEPKRRVIRRGFNYCPAAKCQREAAAGCRREPNPNYYAWFEWYQALGVEVSNFPVSAGK